MAEAILQDLYGDHYQVYSAGTDPKPINPLTIKVLQEIGIDISSNISKNLSIFQGKEMDYVVYLCSDEGRCPVFFRGKKYVKHEFPDPVDFKHKKDEIEKFRELRNEIKKWIKKTFKVNK